MKVSKRIITFFLVIAMLVSVCPFAMAASTSGILVDSASVASWNNLIANNVKSGVSATVPQNKYWSHINSFFSQFGVGALSSDDLSRFTAQLDRSGSGIFGLVIESVIDSFALLWSSPDYVVMYDSSLGVYRPYDNKAMLWVVNSLGHFPYYRPESDSGEEDPDQEIYRTGQWVESSKLGSDTDLWHVASNYELNEYRDQWLDLYPNAKVTETTNYYWLTIQTATAVWVLCDKYGYPYYLPKDGKTAIGTENNYYQDTTNEYIDDDSVHVEVQDGGSALVGSPIDVNNGIVNVGGEVFYIDDLIYDASTQTYYVDAHDEYVFNSTTNNYTTNNYSFTIQYHIDHTSITYIGQTEEYEKRYEMYFELPDGRSSADLTAEDLEQLSVVFSDVIPYVRTADNLDQRVLYHFDGNTEDSSYWSYCSQFDWSEGASLTYMDEGTFGGSLYLDETDHTFTITLPNNDAAADWTLQFRYYQSHTSAPVKDSFIAVGGHVVLWFTGTEYQAASGSVLAATSVGSWNEICIIRSSNTLYYYVNGVFLYSTSDSVYHGNYINFHFGSEQQTYKKLDELRFTSSVVYSPGLDYIPSSVPFDSNLTLVLPDSGTLEDQGIGLVPSDNNLLTESGLDDWTHFNVVGNLYDDVNALKYGNGVNGNWFPFNWSNPIMMYNPDYISFSNQGSAVGVTFASLTPYLSHTTSGQRAVYPSNSVFFPFSVVASSSYESFSEYFGLWGFKQATYYTFSVVLADGSYSYATFSLNKGYCLSLSAVVNNSGIKLVYRDYGFYSGDAVNKVYRVQGIGLEPVDDLSSSIIYMELIEGTRPQFKFSKLYSGSVVQDLGEVIPDEYVQLSTPLSGNLLDGYELSDWSAGNFSYRCFSGEHISDIDYSAAGSAFASSSLVVFDTDFVSVSPGDVGMIVDFGGHEPYSICDSSCNYYCYNLRNALFLPVSYKSGLSSKVPLFGTSQGQVYTLSVVLADGTSSSITFSYGSHGTVNVASTRIDSVIKLTAGLGYIGCDDYCYNNGIYIYSDVVDSAEIIYMELAEGTESLFSCSRVTSVYSADSLADSPVLAVRTNREITGYQIGGVRPSYPTTGLVYAMVEHGRIVSLQQYTGYAWEEVDGRIWTGERWIPYSSFDVFTLQDFYDIIGGSDDDYEYIYTESGFWHWLQGAWTKMLQKLDAIILALGGDPNALPGGSSGNDQNLTFWQRVKKIFEDSLSKILESLLELITNILDRVLGLVYDLLDFFFGLITDIVVEGIGGFFDALMDEALLHFFRSDEPVLDEDGNPVLDEDGNPVTVPVVALPAGVAGIFSFISAVIMVLPDELRYVLFFGIGALFLLGALKLVRS